MIIRNAMVCSELKLVAEDDSTDGGLQAARSLTADEGTLGRPWALRPGLGIGHAARPGWPWRHRQEDNHEGNGHSTVAAVVNLAVVLLAKRLSQITPLVQFPAAPPLPPH